MKDGKTQDSPQNQREEEEKRREEERRGGREEEARREYQLAENLTLLVLATEAKTQRPEGGNRPGSGGRTRDGGSEK